MQTVETDMFGGMSGCVSGASSDSPRCVPVIERRAPLRAARLNDVCL